MGCKLHSKKQASEGKRITLASQEGHKSLEVTNFSIQKVRQKKNPSRTLTDVKKERKRERDFSSDESSLVKLQRQKCFLLFAYSVAGVKRAIKQLLHWS